ncbi:MAG: hypothetical protein NT149_03560 [Candidatus Gottesmanbacteria bacterium]|nr:hypothetical protein [Candidatus Gottesmanbacteria bacterium]
MKTILLLLLAFVIGFGGVVGYQYFKTKRETPLMVTPAAQPTVEPTFALVIKRHRTALRFYLANPLRRRQIHPRLRV